MAYREDEATHVPDSSNSGSALVMPNGPKRRLCRKRAYGSPGPTVRATMPEMMFDVPDE